MLLSIFKLRKFPTTLSRVYDNVLSIRHSMVEAKDLDAFRNDVFMSLGGISHRTLFQRPGMDPFVRHAIDNRSRAYEAQGSYFPPAVRCMRGNVSPLLIWQPPA
jgi:hypothetical protein